MGSRGPKWWFPLISGPAEIVKLIVVPLYRLLFGWADKRCAKRAELRLAADIKLSLGFLFTEENARTIPNEGVPFPPGFDYAFVTLALNGLFLRFSRGREELGVHVAPASAPFDWHDLSLVLCAATGQSELQRQTFGDLWDVSKALRPHMKALIEICSAERFNELKQRLETEIYKWDRIAIKEAEFEINSRLYGGRPN